MVRGTIQVRISRGRVTMNHHLLGWTKEILPRQVKETYVLAMRMSDGPFDAEGFRSKIESELRAVATLPDKDLNELITDKGRLRRFEAGRWELSLVDLTSCVVWPAGDRRGRVDQAAGYLAQGEGSRDRVSSIPRIGHLTLLLLPIITLRRNDDPRRFNIEDGVHRSTAYYLDGLRVVPALVGTVPSELNHKWPWS
jgi:hypothetical protein